MGVLANSDELLGVGHNLLGPLGHVARTKQAVTAAVSIYLAAVLCLRNLQHFPCHKKVSI